MMIIPTRNECYRLMWSMDMMAHIVAHSLQVCRVALKLSDLMIRAGIHLNRNLIEAAALLHDITKTRSFETGENHASSGQILLVELGWPEVGEIVGQHVILERYFASDSPCEAEIVNYADKRVLHDQVVSLHERKAYILERYGTDDHIRSRIQEIWDKTEIMEDRILSSLQYTLNILNPLLSNGDVIKEIDRYNEINRSEENDT